jgi:hypothetical protein
MRMKYILKVLTMKFSLNIQNLQLIKSFSSINVSYYLAIFKVHYSILG